MIHMVRVSSMVTAYSTECQTPGDVPKKIIVNPVLVVGGGGGVLP